MTIVTLSSFTGLHHFTPLNIHYSKASVSIFAVFFPFRHFFQAQKDVAKIVTLSTDASSGCWLQSVPFKGGIFLDLAKY